MWFKVAFLKQSLTSNRCSINIYWLQGGQTIYERELGEREIRLSKAEFQKFQYFSISNGPNGFSLIYGTKVIAGEAGVGGGQGFLSAQRQEVGWAERGCWKLLWQLVQETTRWADGRDSRRTRGAGGDQVGKLREEQSGGLWAAWF